MAEPLTRLFEDDDTVSRFREVFSLGKEDSKKRILPDVVPGFKASALDLGKCSITVCCIYTGIASTKHGAEAADGLSGAGIARPV